MGIKGSRIRLLRTLMEEQELTKMNLFLSIWNKWNYNQGVFIIIFHNFVLKHKRDPPHYPLN